MKQPEFNEELHRYLVDGKEVPFVSEILKVGGFVSFPKAAEKHLEKAASRGRAIHKACALYDSGQLDWSELHDDIVPYVRGYERFTNEHCPSWRLVEVPLYHEELDFAGTIDREGEVSYVEEASGEGVWELKAVSTIRSWYELQLTGYNILADSIFGSDSRRGRSLVLLNLKKDATFKIEVIPKERHEFLEKVFIGAIHGYHYKNPRP